MFPTMAPVAAGVPEFRSIPAGSFLVGALVFGGSGSAGGGFGAVPPGAAFGIAPAFGGALQGTMEPQALSKESEGASDEPVDDSL
jgi:hypothetical protein